MAEEYSSDNNAKELHDVVEKMVRAFQEQGIG